VGGRRRKSLPQKALTLALSHRERGQENLSQRERG
jgi:hypothetical protein